MVQTAIEARSLTKVYQGLIRRRAFTALSHFSLSLPQGRIFGLLGPNGAGKTTFIKILLGIIKKSSGDASVLGMPAGSVECRRQIGYLPEQMRIPRHLTGMGALKFYGSLSGMDRASILARAPELIEKVGLAGREQELARKYSKGMVQRIGLAQALLHRPKILVLDEPTDGLDPRARREMRELLLKLRADEGVTIFLNSHILQEVEMVCDDVAIMHRGTLRYSGPVSDVNRFFSKGKSETTWQARIQVEGPASRIAEVFHGVGAIEFDGAFSVPASPTPLPSASSAALLAADDDIPLADQVSSQHASSPTTDSAPTFATDLPDTRAVAVVSAEFPSQMELDACIDRLRAAGLSLVGLSRDRVSLEDAFMQLTGGEQ